MKRALFTLCQEHLDDRIRTAREAIDAAQRAANNETKSSSGDKYETGRAMMQLEVGKNAVQLSASMKLRHALDRIPREKTSTAVASGSLVITDRGSFFIAISLGKVSVEGKDCFVVSPGSPLGARLMGLKTGDTVMFQDQECRITEIV